MSRIRNAVSARRGGQRAVRRVILLAGLLGSLGALAASGVPAYASNSTQAPGFEHVVYLTGSGHAEEFYYPLGQTGPHWKMTDVTSQVTGAASAAPGSALTSWADSGYEHVVYLTGSGHAEEFYYPLGETGPHWKMTDVTSQVAGAASAAPGSALTSWADSSYEHVVYLTGSGHAEEFYYPLGQTGPHWKMTDVTSQVAGAASAAPGSALTSWAR